MFPSYYKPLSPKFFDFQVPLPIFQSLQGKESRAGASDGANGERYQFGDFTRGLLAAGRESRGEEGGNQGYKPGDLTRGIWSKLKR